MRTLMTRGSERGTAISLAHSSGTASKPTARAATAGNSALRSFVAVKMQLTTFSGTSALRSMIAFISSVVASRMSWASLRFTLIAPRRAKSRSTRAILSERAEPLDLARAELPVRPGLEALQAQRAKADAPQLEHRVADRLAHSPHLAVSALVDRQLDQVPADAAHACGHGRPV